jgi:hypothetical protein
VGFIDLLRCSLSTQIDPDIVTGEREGELDIPRDFADDIDRIDGPKDGLADAQEVGQRQPGVHCRSHGPIGGEVRIGALVFVAG